MRSLQEVFLFQNPGKTARLSFRKSHNWQRKTEDLLFVGLSRSFQKGAVAILFWFWKNGWADPQVSLVFDLETAIICRI